MSTALGSIFGGIMGLGQTALNYELGRRQTDYDRRQNALYNEAAAEKADQRTRALYEDYYSPSALLRQYQEAGLSPSLMFGGTPGQGGMSGAQSNGANGMQTPFMPYSMVEAAQAASLFAQAKKTNAETETIEGKNELGKAQITKIWQEAAGAEAAAELSSATARLETVNAEIQEGGKDWSIKRMEHECYKASAEANYALWESFDKNLEYDFNLDTYETRKQQLLNETTEIATKIALEKSQRKLTDTQRKQLDEEIKLIYSNYLLDKQRVINDIKRVKQEGKSIDNQKEQWEKQNKQFHEQLNFTIKKYLGESWLQAGNMIMNYMEAQTGNILSGAAILTGKKK